MIGGFFCGVGLPPLFVSSYSSYSYLDRRLLLRREVEELSRGRLHRRDRGLSAFQTSVGEQRGACHISSRSLSSWLLPFPSVWLPSSWMLPKPLWLPLLDCKDGLAQHCLPLLDCKDGLAQHVQTTLAHVRISFRAADVRGRHHHHHPLSPRAQSPIQSSPPPSGIPAYVVERRPADTAVATRMYDSKMTTDRCVTCMLRAGVNMHDGRMKHAGVLDDGKRMCKRARAR